MPQRGLGNEVEEQTCMAAQIPVPVLDFLLPSKEQMVKSEGEAGWGKLFGRLVGLEVPEQMEF